MYSVKDDVTTLELSTEELDFLEDAVNKSISSCYYDDDEIKEISNIHNKLVAEQRLRNSLCESTIFISKKKTTTFSCFLDDFYEIKKGSYWKLLEIRPDSYFIKNIADGVSTVIDKRIFDKIFKEIKRC